MILIGQYDSPYVRRAGIAMRLYGIQFEHKPWSTFSDADKIRPYNPLTRVPTLVLDDGDVLTESHIILDYLDGLVPAARRMYPVAEPARHRALGVAALATGATDKAVSLFYEKRLHSEVSDMWVTRCLNQIGDALSRLESERARGTSQYWFGAEIGHADIAAATGLRFISDAHGDLIPLGRYPTLKRQAEQMEAMPVFQEIRQPFIPPS